jgi:hypothetical protein
MIIMTIRMISSRIMTIRMISSIIMTMRVKVAELKKKRHDQEHTHRPACRIVVVVVELLLLLVLEVVVVVVVVVVGEVGVGGEVVVEGVGRSCPRLVNPSGLGRK